MTLKNARPRFEAMGWEVERQLMAPRVYRVRRIGASDWQFHDGSLHYLLSRVLYETEGLAPKPVMQPAIQPDPV